MSSTLEITDNEFLIKLDRRKFKISFVRTLLKMVEFSQPAAEETYDLTDRHMSPNNRSVEPDYFGKLDEK